MGQQYHVVGFCQDPGQPRSAPRSVDWRRDSNKPGIFHCRPKSPLPGNASGVHCHFSTLPGWSKPPLLFPCRPFPKKSTDCGRQTALDMQAVSVHNTYAIRNE